VTEAPPSGNDLVEGVYRWPSGVSIQYTEGWEIVEDGEIVHIINTELDIAIYLYPVRDERDTNLPTAIRETFARVSTKAFDEENFYFLTLANDAQALGYSMSAGEFHREINSVSVPLVGPSGEVMSLNCGAAAFVYTEEHLRQVIAPQLLKMAAALAADLGGHVPQPR
jgi:hypothetical protein